MARFYIRETPIGSAILKPADILRELPGIVEADQEAIYVFSLNARNRIIGKDLVSLGGFNGATVDPKVIFRRILQHGATAFLVVHNHPSGIPTPSEQDRSFTAKLMGIAKILDLAFHDHIIVASEGCYSFSRFGLLQ